MSNPARLWAPWRSRYLSHGPTRRCIFCAAKHSTADRQHQVIARDAEVFAMLNRYPYNNGHIMVAPYRHVGTLDSLTSSEWVGIFLISKRLTDRLLRLLRPHGFNIGLNLGRVAGAGIPGHLHLHIVPRWAGDTNFMPVVANTKIISQSLNELYALLAERRPSGA